VHTGQRTHVSTTNNMAVTILAVLFALVVVSVMFPDRFQSHSRERPRQKTCLSQMHQLATACLTYSQDHQSIFPGAGWVKEIAPYVHNKTDLFSCHSDSSSTGVVISYGYNSLMVLPDGSGVMQKDVISPREVGMVCDASPSRSFPDGSLVVGGELQLTDKTTVIPDPRHCDGTNIGYADGHVFYAANGYNPQDISNYVTRAFYMASSLDYINNPAGGICGFGNITTTADPICIGDEPCTAPILRAAAGVWTQQAHAPIANTGFNGQYAVYNPVNGYL